MLHGEKIPLNDDHRRVIDDNRHALTLLIDPDSGIISRLHANRCFNSLHKDYIEHGVGKLDKVDKLLDILRRRSVGDFRKLVDALERDGQPQLAQMLRQRGSKLIKLQLYFNFAVYASEVLAFLY